MQMKYYLIEMRIKHYIKNLLIFMPAFFAGVIFEISTLIACILAFLSFSLMSSVVYILNDIHDIEKDRIHPRKCKRPIASGAISKSSAIVFSTLLLIISVVLGSFLISKSIYTIIIIFGYLIVNIIYSIAGGKNYALFDVVLLVSGFYLRVMMGAYSVGVEISDWLILVIISGASFMAFGKRRNETIQVGTKTREVLNQYSEDFLDKAMYSCMTLSLCFFALWCSEQGTKYIVLFPLLLLLLLRYSMQVEGNDEGDPTTLILKDKLIIFLGMLIGFISLMLIYR